MILPQVAIESNNYNEDFFQFYFPRSRYTGNIDIIIRSFGTGKTKGISVVQRSVFGGMMGIHDIEKTGDINTQEI